MKIKDIMTSDVIYAEVPGSTADALDKVLKHNISGIPVVKRGTKEVMGVVTRTDFARNPEEGQLALLMTRDPFTTTEDKDIKEAAKLFSQSSFRRMPVVKNGELTGIITVSDIVWKGLGRMDIENNIEPYMEANITTIWEKTPLKVAYEILRHSKERALPVLNSEAKLSGIISDTDLLNLLEITESTHKSELSSSTEGDRWGWDSKNVVYITKKKLEMPDKVVKDVMVKDVVTATKRTGISECAKRMAKAKIEQIPIIDAEGELVAIVRDIDMLHAIL